MYLYNTTFVVDNNHIDAWQCWLTADLICNIYDAVPSAEIEVYEIDNRLEHTPGCTSFSCQCKCDDMSDLRTIKQITEKIVGERVAKANGAFAYFSTMMKKVVL